MRLRWGYPCGGVVPDDSVAPARVARLIGEGKTLIPFSRIRGAVLRDCMQ